MLTSKQRSEFRAQANTLETTLMVGKDGVTDAVIAEADRLLTARELVKGKVLEAALMSAREVSDAICEATGADGISCVGNKFVIWRFSEKCQEERNQTGRAKRKETPKSKADPVRKGIRARRAAEKKVRDPRKEYFRQQAREKAGSRRPVGDAEDLIIRSRINEESSFSQIGIHFCITFLDLRFVYFILTLVTIVF